MTVYIALLRGINVGGKNMIKMAELKRMFQNIGLGRVQTYIQSGNVLFESDAEEEPLRRRIEQEIEATFGFSVTVILRTSGELEQIIEQCPFTEEAVTEAAATAQGESLYVSLMPEAPSPEAVEKLRAFKSDREEYRVIGREVYLLFRDSIRNSKLASSLPKLNVPGTVRNWRTISKLALLAKALEG